MKNIFLILIILVISVAASAENFEDSQITNYKVQIQPDFKSKTLVGTTEIILKAKLILKIITRISL